MVICNCQEAPNTHALFMAAFKWEAGCSDVVTVPWGKSELEILRIISNQPRLEQTRPL